MDNVRPHVAKLVLAWLAKNKITVVPHPPYSPDLAPNDFFLYPAVKKVLKGIRFPTIGALKKKVHAQLNLVAQNGLAAAFEQWEKRWTKCIRLGGSYVERNQSLDVSE